MHQAHCCAKFFWHQPSSRLEALTYLHYYGRGQAGGLRLTTVSEAKEGEWGGRGIGLTITNSPCWLGVLQHLGDMKIYGTTK